MSLTINHRFSLKSLVGRGGMGGVFRVEDARRPGRRLTLKLAHPTGGESANGEVPRWALQGEFLALASLSHPALGQAYVCGTVESVEGVSGDLAPPVLGQVFVVRDFLPGLPLLQAAQGMGQSAKLEALFQLADVLTYIHNQGLLYRDLSPDNILINEVDGRLSLYLVDLGLVAELGATTLRSGTVKYLAPEVLQGGAATLQSEIYSFGMVAYELLGGSHPFEEALDTVALVRSHIEKAIPPLEDLPQPFADLLVNLLEKDPQSRPNTMAGIVTALGYSKGDFDGVSMARRLGEPRLLGRSNARSTFATHLLNRKGVDKKSAAHWGPKWAEGDSPGPSSHCIILTGPGGIGRSRLIQEVCVRSQVLGYASYSTAANGERRDLQGEQGWLNLLWAGVMGRHSTKQTAFFPLLEAVVLQGRHIGAGDLHQKVAWERLQEGGRALFEAEIKHGPLLLIFEDLHRADADTLDWFCHFTEAFAGQDVLIVGSGWTPEPSAKKMLTLKNRLSSQAGVLWMELPGLNTSDVAELTHCMFGESAELALAEELRKHTDGNPLFLSELLRGAGNLDGVGDLLESGHLPGRMEDACKAQLQRVDPETLQVLEGLSVLLHPSTVEELADLLNWAIFRTGAALHRASLAYLIRKQGGRFGFVNGMLGRICEKRLSASRRLHLNLRAAELMEDAPAQPVILKRQAYHWRLGGKLDRALEGLWQGARLAESRFLTRMARVLFEEALQVVEAGGSLPGFSRERLDWEARSRLAHLALWSGEYDTAEAMCHQLLGKIPPLDLPQDSENSPASLYSLLGQVSTRLANYDLAVERFDRALAACTDDILAGEILDHLAEVLFRRGDNEGGEAAAQAALKRMGGLVAPALKASVVAHLGKAAQARSAYGEALSFFQRAYDGYNEVGHIRGMAESLGSKSRILELQDKLIEALRTQEESLSLQEEVGDAEGIAGTLLRLGVNQYMIGHATKGVGYLERSLSLYRQLKNPQGVGRALNALGILHQVRGAYGDALSTREEAFADQERLGDRPGMGLTLASVAMVYLEVGAIDLAREASQQALALIEGGELRRLARCLHIQGMVELLAGRREEGRKYLLKSAETFEELGMAEAQSGVLAGLSQERLEAGQIEEAWALVERALDLTRTLGQPSILQAQVTRARVLLSRVELDLETLEPCLEEALRIATQLNYADFLWQVFELKGRLLLKQDRPMEASRWLKKAMDVVFLCHKQLPETLRSVYVQDPRRQTVRTAMELALRRASWGRGGSRFATPKGARPRKSRRSLHLVGRLPDGKPESSD